MGSYDSIIIQDEKERLFTAYATVEIKDKQGQFVPLSNFKKAFYKFMIKGSPLNWMHTNRTIGKVLNGEEEQLGDYKAFKITAMIYGHDDDIKEYDEAWDAIKNGLATGVSIGGGQPLLITKQNKEGQVDELVTIPLLEISVVESPANPLALITGFSMAKSDYMAKPGNVDETKWNEAKQKVREEYKDISEDSDRFYALTQTIYQNMTKSDEDVDIININVPTITRLFEFVLESNLDDVALHKMLERLVEASKSGTLTMDSYNLITTENLEKSEANTMDNEVPKASEQIDLAKTLNSLNENISKLYSMVEKALAKTEVSAPEENKKEVEVPKEEVKDDVKEEGKPDVAEEAKEEGKTPEQEAKEENLEKGEKVYVSNPSEVPKGAHVQTGERGGHYYESNNSNNNSSNQSKPKTNNNLNNDDKYKSILNSKNKKIIDDSIKAAIYNNEKNVNIDTDKMISLFTDNLTPEEYKNFNQNEAEDYILNYAKKLFDDQKNKQAKSNTEKSISEVNKMVEEEKKPEQAPAEEKKPETEAEPKDISEEESTEKEGEDMEKADNGKITELEAKVAELQKQLSGNIQKSVTTVAPTVQPEGAIKSNPSFVWDYVKKEKGL